MFSKNKISETDPKDTTAKPAAPVPPKPSAAGSDSFGSVSTQGGASAAAPATQKQPKPSPSLLSSDLTVKGNVITSGDVQVEGTIEGDVRAHLLTVGESATIRGEVIADDVVVNGRVIGRLRGLKVRLTATARVEGDIVHKTIAIESGAHFEGSVQRQEDPIGDSKAGETQTGAGAPKAAETAKTGATAIGGTAAE
jgi:cytoskeletal protein CcmA (bactofilin family)